MVRILNDRVGIATEALVNIAMAMVYRGRRLAVPSNAECSVPQVRSCCEK